MYNSGMADFDLHRAIADWRRALAHTGDLLPDDLDELESHLRDEIESLEGEGELTNRAAFALACRRLGTAAELGREYRKVKPWASWHVPLGWMLLGCVIWAVVFRLWNAAVTITLWLDYSTHFGAAALHTAVVVATFAMVAAGLVAARWLAARSFAQRPWSYVTMLLLGLAATCITVYGDVVVGKLLGLFIHQRATDEATWALHLEVLDTAYSAMTVALAVCLSGAAIALTRRRTHAALHCQPMYWLLVSFFLWSGAMAALDLGVWMMLIGAAELGVGLAGLRTLGFAVAIVIPVAAVWCVRALITRYPVQAVSRPVATWVLGVAAALTMTYQFVSQTVLAGAMQACGGGTKLGEVMRASSQAYFIVVALSLGFAGVLWRRRSTTVREV